MAKNTFDLTCKPLIQLYAKNLKYILKNFNFLKVSEDFPRLLLQFGSADGRVCDLPGPPSNKIR
jgi:hypothetical protein